MALTTKSDVFLLCSHTEHRSKFFKYKSPLCDDSMSTSQPFGSHAPCLQDLWTELQQQSVRHGKLQDKASVTCYSGNKFCQENYHMPLVIKCIPVLEILNANSKHFELITLVSHVFSTQYCGTISYHLLPTVNFVKHDFALSFKLWFNHLPKLHQSHSLLSQWYQLTGIMCPY